MNADDDDGGYILLVRMMACGLGDCAMDGDWWHVASIYGEWEVPRGFWVGHEESGDRTPAGAITPILSGPSKLSKARITTSQPTL